MITEVRHNAALGTSLLGGQLAAEHGRQSESAAESKVVDGELSYIDAKKHGESPH